MKKSIIYCIFFFFSSQGFSQSFVKTYTDHPQNYNGVNVLPINTSQTAVLGFETYNQSFMKTVDSNGNGRCNSNFFIMYNSVEESNLTKMPNGYVFFYEDITNTLMGNYQYLVFLNDTLGLIKEDNFFNGNISYAWDVNLYCVLNKGAFFTCSISGVSFSSSPYSYTFISNYDSAGNLKWNDSFGANNNSQVFNSIITSDSAIAVIGIVYDTVQLKKYDFKGNFIWDCKFPSLVNTASKILEVNKNILGFGNVIDISTNKNQLVLEIVNLNGSLIAQKKFILNNDTANITPIAVYATSDTTAVLNYTVAGSTLNHYLIVDYKGDSLGSFVLPAYTVSTFDNCNYLCALDSTNQIIVREFNPQGAIIYKYVYQPSDSLNVCNDIKPLPYPGRFVLTGSSNNNLLIIRQDTSVYNSIKEIGSDKNEINVFPNPVTNATTILLTTYGKHFLEIDDITGRKIKWIEFTGKQYELNTESLSKGLYFITVFDSNKNLIGTSKIVVQ